MQQDDFEHVVSYQLTVVIAEEMAEAILFLADPRQDYMTGACLLVDGGISLPWWASRGSAAPD